MSKIMKLVGLWKVSTQRSSLRHNKGLKPKRKNFKSHQRGGKIFFIYKGTLRISEGFLAETLQARRNWGSRVRVLKEKNQPVKKFSLGKIVLYKWREKDLPRKTKKHTQKKTKLRDFTTTRPASQEAGDRKF